MVLLSSSVWEFSFNDVCVERKISVYTWNFVMRFREEIHLVVVIPE